MFVNSIAWAGSGWMGRVDFNEFGEGIDGKCGKLSKQFCDTYVLKNEFDLFENFCND